MAYVFEHISDGDFIKYRVADSSWGCPTPSFRSWAIDREQDVYLREASRDRDELTNEYFSFYWKGYEWPVYVYQMQYTKRTNEAPAYLRLRVEFRRFPPALESMSKDIQSDFMLAYRSFPGMQGMIIDFEF